MKDTKPLIIALLAISLVGTWAYHLYDKSRYSQLRPEAIVRDSVAIAAAVKDSLQKVYNDTIQAMDTRLTSAETGTDSLKNQLDFSLSEINKLRNQINAILKKPANKEDLALARQMIGELQGKVDNLSGANSSIEEEKTRLASQMQVLTKEIEDLQGNVKSLNDQNKVMADQIKAASVFIATEMNLNAMEVKANKEEETAVARKADKFVASFVVQNPINEYISAEVIIVVIQPDGHVLQISDWDAGSFETKSQGLKNYTRKVKFDYEKGEQKQILFSLNTDNFQKGTYKLQLWHKGIMIGQTNKTLS